MTKTATVEFNEQDVETLLYWWYSLVANHHTYSPGGRDTEVAEKITALYSLIKGSDY